MLYEKLKENNKNPLIFVWLFIVPNNLLMVLAYPSQDNWIYLYDFKIFAINPGTFLEDIFVYLTTYVQCVAGICYLKDPYHRKWKRSRRSFRFQSLQIQSSPQVSGYYWQAANKFSRSWKQIAPCICQLMSLVRMYRHDKKLHQFTTDFFLLHILCTAIFHKRSLDPFH